MSTWIYESTDDYPSPDVVHGTLKCLAGHATPVILKDTGETILVPDSISFSREEEVLRCIGASNWTSPEPSPSSPNAGPAVDGRALIMARINSAREEPMTREQAIERMKG